MCGRPGRVAHRMNNPAANSALPAITAYAKWAAADFDRDGHEALVGLYTRQAWHRGADGHLRQEPISQATALKLFDVLKDANPELYKAATAAVEADPVFGAWLDGMVGTPLGSFHFDAASLINSCVAAQLSSDGTFERNDAAVAAHFEEYRQFVSADHVQAHVLVPLPGL